MVELYGLFLVHQVNLLQYTDKSVVSLNPYTTPYIYMYAYTYIILNFIRIQLIAIMNFSYENNYYTRSDVKLIRHHQCSGVHNFRAKKSNNETTCCYLSYLNLTYVYEHHDYGSTYRYYVRRIEISLKLIPEHFRLGISSPKYYGFESKLL